MNRSFDYVMRSSINHSKSKEAHLFAQAKRFPQPRPPNCNKQSYDLRNTMLAASTMTKSTAFPRQVRFKSNHSTSPSPDAYHRHSFTDLNRQSSKGVSFGNAEKLKQIDKHKIPGPGAYQHEYNPEKKLLYTMRSRVPHKDHSSRLGPGQYQIEGYHSVTNFNQIHAKYTNPKTPIIGKERRFNDKSHITPGPGPTVHAELGIGLTGGSGDPVFSFGSMKKGPSYISKNGTPGPGSYCEFSQFAELKKGGERSAVVAGRARTGGTQ